MAVGLWNKLKNFGKKAWKGISAVAKPIMSVARPLVNQFKDVIPGGGMISKALDFADDKIVRPYMGDGDRRVHDFMQKSQPFLKMGTEQLSNRIKFK